MLKGTTLKPSVRTTLISSASRFVRGDNGSMTIFAVMMLMMMLLVGGIAVDLMRNEMERTKVQGVMDRAVLASADLDQTLDPKAVVEDYFAKTDMADYLVSVTPDNGINYRTVTASARTTTPTQFMRLMGVETLPVSVRGQAEERIANVEISMVLDISGSMDDNDKIENLRDAAEVFVDTVLTDSTEDLVSISLIPYSEHVNAGPQIFNQLNTIHRHDFSHCLEIPNSEFLSEKFNTALTYDQVQHFQWNPGDSGTYYRYLVEDTICPQYDYERIRPVTQNKSALVNQIKALQPRAGTSIFLGMKWGVALLDPSMRGIVTNTMTGNDPLKGRPADYTDPETLKSVILMTDGKNSNSNRIVDWAYDSASEYAHWDKYNFRWYENNYWNSNYYGSLDYQKYNAATGDTLLDQICDAAKLKGIVIWSIGFEVDQHGSDVMESCASSPSHYFEVEGVEITEAFKAIAKQINQLRLTQ